MISPKISTQYTMFANAITRINGVKFLFKDTEQEIE